jgi:hypothetical protein
MREAVSERCTSPFIEGLGTEKATPGFLGSSYVSSSVLIFYESGTRSPGCGKRRLKDDFVVLKKTSAPVFFKGDKSDQEALAWTKRGVGSLLL